MCYVAQIIICQTYQNTGPRIILLLCILESLPIGYILIKLYAAINNIYN